jgi:hypothetical protein
MARSGSVRSTATASLTARSLDSSGLPKTSSRRQETTGWNISRVWRLTGLNGTVAVRAGEDNGQAASVAEGRTREPRAHDMRAAVRAASGYSSGVQIPGERALAQSVLRRNRRVRSGDAYVGDYRSLSTSDGRTSTGTGAEREWCCRVRHQRFQHMCALSRVGPVSDPAAATANSTTVKRPICYRLRDASCWSRQSRVPSVVLSRLDTTTRKGGHAPPPALVDETA